MAVEHVHLFDEAYRIIHSLASHLPSESLAIQAAQGRVVSESVYANTSLPPFPRAMMDGYAVNSDDIHEVPCKLRITGSIQAGTPTTQRLHSGEALRITTGSPMPEGADAVARQEWCDETGDVVTILKAVPKNESVQPLGDDGSDGQLLLTAGSVLHSEQLALCQGFGVHTVSVYARPRVRLIITGDEVAPNPGVSLEAAQVYSVNDIILRLQLMEDGCDVPAPVFAPDNPEAIADAVREATADADYVITTGGVSVGSRDYLAPVLESMQAQIELRKIMMRPGSPLVAAHLGKSVVFALSGNPAAAFTQFETLIRPAIRSAFGRRDTPFPLTAKLEHGINLKPIKPTRILRGQATIQNAEVHVNVEMAQSSGVISSFGSANCLVRIDEPELAAQTIVPIRWFRFG